MNFKKLLALALAFVTLLSIIPITATAATTTIKGIDVSKYQGTIDWAKVKADGIEFAILRVGYSNTMDPTFERNYAGAKAVGINVGAYYYSYAKNAETAKSNAETVKKWLAGKQFEYPIYIDIEDPSQLEAGMTTAIRTSICTTFNDTLAEAGYYMGVYANKNWFNNYLDYNLLKAKYTIWWAQYPSNDTPVDLPTTDRSHQCDIWQFSSKGIVSGITANTVDMNVGYVDFAKIIKEGGYNGYGDGQVPPQSAYPADGKAYYSVTASTLNLRSEATTSSTVLTGMPNGSLVAVLDFNSDRSWAKVNYNGTVGWASMQYLAFVRNFMYTVTHNSGDGYNKTQTEQFVRGESFSVADITTVDSGKIFHGYTIYRVSDGMYLTEKGTWRPEAALGPGNPAKYFSAGTAFTLDESTVSSAVGDDTFILTGVLEDCVHSSTAPATIKEATETEEGLIYHICETCASVVREETIPVKQPEVNLGDVNGDGRISAVDYSTLRKVIAGDENTVYIEINSDINGDKRITAVDLTAMRVLLAGE